MYSVTAALFGLIIFIVTFMILRRLRDPLRLIPGPRGIPFIGVALSTDFSTFHTKVDEWRRIYGPVMKFTIMGRQIVVLSGIDVVREALVYRGTDFAGRPDSYRAQRVTYGKDIAFQSFSSKTMALKKMAIQALRPYGDGMKRLEGIMDEAATEFIDDIGSKNGRPFEIERETSTFLCNVMATILYGERLALDHPTVRLVTEMNRSILHVLEPTSAGREIDSLPWLRHTFLARRGMEILEKAERMRAEILEKKVQEAQDTLDPTRPRGCLDQFLLAKAQEYDDAKQPMWDMEHMSALCLDFITGGMSTTSSSMSEIYLLLLHYPDLQEKIQKEIDSVVGRARAPKLHDMDSMPYTNAFVLEALRYTSVVPLSLPKMTMADSNVGDYRIPAGTTVLINIWSVHHDERVYPEPFEFRPERFLSESGDLLPHDHPIRASFIAFGLGRRLCIAENLARSRLLLLVTRLLQRFTLVKDDTTQLPNVDPRTFTMGLVIQTPKFSLCALPRY